MADEKVNDNAGAEERVPDSIVEIRKGKKVLIVKGFCCKDTKATAADKMARVLQAEAAMEDLFDKIA